MQASHALWFARRKIFLSVLSSVTDCGAYDEHVPKIANACKVPRCIQLCAQVRYRIRARTTYLRTCARVAAAIEMYRVRARACARWRGTVSKDPPSPPKKQQNRVLFFLCLVDPELLRNSETNRSGSLSKGSLTLGISGSTFPSSSSPSLSLPQFSSPARRETRAVGASSCSSCDAMDHAGDSSFPACFETWIPFREKYVPPRRARGMRESRGRRGSLSRLRAIVSHKGNSGLFARGVGPGWLRPPLEPHSCLPPGGTSHVLPPVLLSASPSPSPKKKPFVLLPVFLGS